MAKKVKRFRPAKQAKSSENDRTRFAIPTPPPAPSQPKLDGFSSPELEALEGAIESFAVVQDRVKEEKKKLQTELDKEEATLIEAMEKAGQVAIVIGGYIVSIQKSTKARVKGAPKKKKPDDDEDGGPDVDLGRLAPISSIERT